MWLVDGTKAIFELSEMEPDEILTSRGWSQDRLETVGDGAWLMVR